MTRAGMPVTLGRRAFKVLVVLLEAEGELVSNEDILLRVWDGSIVEHNSVQAQISALRRALGDDRALLKTYSGRGYRLMTASQRTLTSPAGDRARTSNGLRMRPGVTNLPLPVGELFGREDAVEELIDLFFDHRLVTVSGPGGIGKTRLVIDTAAQSGAAFPGGIFFVDLATVSDPDLVASAIIAGTRVEPGFDLSLAERARALGDEPVLVVLDNCEHIVDAATQAVETLLAANQALHVVATSREPLRARGEVIYRVASLEVPGPLSNDRSTLDARGASRLFVDRAAVDVSLLADSAVADAIAKICRDLDGIPLAIELAAARARSLGIREISSRLHECLDLLRGGNRTALPRQRTLRATLEWSYDLLSTGERTVLRRLAVFVGGFGLEAAGAVASDDGLSDIEVVGVVGDLVEKSMVSTDLDPVHPRYRLLETTRAFALERLVAADEAAIVARRHADYRLETLRRVDMQSQTPRLASTLAGFRTDIDNLRATLDWSNGTHGDSRVAFTLASFVAPVMLDLLLIDECLTRAAAALVRMPPTSDRSPDEELRLRTVVAASQVYIAGPCPAAMQSWRDALAAARSAGDRPFEIRALWGLWTACTFAGLPREALAWATTFSDVLRVTQDDASVTLAQRIRGICHHYLGDHGPARATLETMIAGYVHGAHRVKMGGLLNHRTVARATLSRVLWFQGLPEQSLDMMRDSVRDAIEEDHAISIGYVAAECALPLSLLVGDRAAARSYLAVLFSSSQRHGLVVLQLVGQCYEAILDNDDAPSGESLAKLSATLVRLSDLHFDVYSADLSCHLAQALVAAGRMDDALSICDRTLERTAHSGERLWEPELLRMRAVALLASGRPEAPAVVEVILSEALALASEQASLSLELRIAKTLAGVLATQGHAVDGLNRLDEVYGRFEEGFDTADLVDARRQRDALRSASRRTVATVQSD